MVTVKILIACEESQAVCKEFRKLGHEAYSCDILPCSGGHPEWHIQDDVLKHLDEGWDLMIAHPPCTYLSRAGARWLYPKTILNQERYKKGLEAKEFFFKLLNANIPMIAIENPTPFKIFELPEFTQSIQPFEYGHEFSKKTLLWLKNLPKLKPTNIIEKYKPLLPSNTGEKREDRNIVMDLLKIKKKQVKLFQVLLKQWLNNGTNQRLLNVPSRRTTRRRTAFLPTLKGRVSCLKDYENKKRTDAET